MKVKSPIFDIEATGKNKALLQELKRDFNELSSEEKFDVVEFQSMMMASLSRYNELSGIKNKNERDVNDIISRMSSRSLDHSQRCIAYLRSQMSPGKEK